MEFAILGLGRMGGGLALDALEKGADVVGHTRSGARPEQFAAGLREIKDLAKLRDALNGAQDAWETRFGRRFDPSASRTA
ncbi:MAG: NAD(P)-binding domain-containing protein [Longimicrobiales bacterium]